MAVVFLSAQTPVITGSIRLPVPMWKLLTTARTSAPDWSCLATQSPEKKAEELDRKGQREWACQRQEIGANSLRHRLQTQGSFTSPLHPLPSMLPFPTLR